MRKFELCYELPDGRVLIPDLLEVSEPCFAFDEQGALGFLLEYKDFLPPSVMPRFIVKRHQEIADNETRRIHIAVTGKERKVFLALIWLTLREINADFAGLKVSERVPLPDNPALSVAYETLLDYAEQGLEKIIPEGTKKAYSVKDLLDGVHFDDPREGERMLALVKDNQEDGLIRRAAETLNKYGEWKPNVMGIGFNFNAWFDELLNREGK